MVRFLNGSAVSSEFKSVSARIRLAVHDGTFFSRADCRSEIWILLIATVLGRKRATVVIAIYLDEGTAGAGFF
jgi:hypothetical protein